MLKTNSKKAIENIWAYIMEDLDYINSGYGYEITEGDRKATAAEMLTNLIYREVIKNK